MPIDTCYTESYFICTLASQDVWHGSGRNRSASRPRRALGVHLLRRDVLLRTEPSPDYIYGRYVLAEGCDEVSEQFFPITWTSEGYVSPVARKRPRCE